MTKKISSQETYLSSLHTYAIIVNIPKKKVSVRKIYQKQVIIIKHILFAVQYIRVQIYICRYTDKQQPHSTTNPTQQQFKPNQTTTPHLDKPNPTTTPQQDKPNPTTTPHLDKPNPTRTPHHDKPNPTTTTRHLDKPTPTTTPQHDKPDPTTTRHTTNPSQQQPYISTNPSQQQATPRLFFRPLNSW